MKLNVNDGKYTFIKHNDGAVSILRYGNEWHPPQNDASNALNSIMYELDAARVVLSAVRHGGDVRAAMEKHDRLVNDTEEPSDWAK